MANERLRAVILEKGLTANALASDLDVDVKTVERWVNGRMPYRRHRYAVSSRLGVDESYLWPDALSRDQVVAASESEVIAVFPHRSEVPRDAWRRLFESGEEEIGVLVYAGLFLAEDTGLLRIIRKKAESGARVRILVGDQEDIHIAERGEQEGIGDAMAAKIRNALALYRPLREVEGIEFRLHRTVLYNSIYRADDQLMVNTHVYGFTAPHAPVWHLRKVPGGEFANVYLESFERVWDTAMPLPED
ncbi:MAG TPA: helix-turn-helix transcriptional regulator [Kribbella sp.]|uniref:helix-turn-helix domain-containing protein n=1 Tax=Kribbella sp. TaxID=1871183 RepID=UPI002D7A2D52|nr:helix-turn-helix transcriptional regulator [Kribbella sp.]HET6292225.1 helix-turn-helix transcriptional regulator [Kribbella sp.]